jgi:RNA polymerase sigma factor (sigma-70 family)
MSQPSETFRAGRNDAELLAAFATQRQETAFAEIVRRHGGMVLAVCRSVLGNTSDAEDAGQAVFLTLARKAASGGIRTPLVGWLHRVAWYIAKRAAVARAIRRQHEQEAARMKPDSIPLDGAPIPSDLLHAALAELPEKYRLPLLLHHIEGRTQEETAALLGCSVSAAAMRLQRGREKLRDRLNRRGLRSSLVGLGAALGIQAHATASPAFVTIAAKMATTALAGPLVSAAGISGQTLALSKGAMHMLFWAKIKTLGVAAAAVLMMTWLVTTAVISYAQTSTSPSVTGSITQVGTASITLQPTSGDAVVVAIDTTTLIKVNGTMSAATDLKVGMNAIAFVKSGQAATEIRAYTPTPPPTQPAPVANPSVFGTITQVSSTSMTLQPSTGSAIVVALDSATAVSIASKPASIADLKVGMHAIAYVKTGQPATVVNAYMPSPPATQPAPAPVTNPSVYGTITQVGSGTITIQPASGAAVVVTLNSSTTVNVGGKPATAAGLQVGMHAIAYVKTGQPATVVNAYMPTVPPTQPAPAASVFGTITQIGAGTMTLQPPNGAATVVVQLNASTVVTISGMTTATIADLKVGMHAMATVKTGQPATTVKAYMPGVTSNTKTTK